MSQQHATTTGNNTNTTTQNITILDRECQHGVRTSTSTAIHGGASQLISICHYICSSAQLDHSARSAAQPDHSAAQLDRSAAQLHHSARSYSISAAGEGKALRLTKHENCDTWYGSLDDVVCCSWRLRQPW
jgi:hypothetical protein